MWASMIFAGRTATFRLPSQPGETTGTAITTGVFLKDVLPPLVAWLIQQYPFLESGELTISFQRSWIGDTWQAVLAT